MTNLNTYSFSYYFYEKNQELKELKGEATYYTEALEDVELDMVYLAGGTFSMGSPEEEPERFDNEGPVHPVKIHPFYIGKYPITQKQWQKVMGNNPSYFSGEDRPVEGISWSHAYHFCEFLKAKTNKNYRLVTEAEWEYACRGNLTTPYYTGYHIDSKMANFNLIGSPSEGKEQPVGQTTKVGTYPPNPFGIYDMCGNVWEWCADVGHRDYSQAQSDKEVEGDACMELQDLTPWVLRGGSFDNKARTLRCANRFKSCPTNRFNTLGFRIAISAKDLVI
jgi:eukaryotic-like serine/threonine-protein kinase